jgi:glycolate oxidase FAD binding subunit
MTTTALAPSIITPTSPADVQEVVRASAVVLPVGAGTKSSLYGSAPATRINLAQLTGIVEYEPGEYTFTAWAGTRLADIRAALAEHGQYLPFDPPLVAAGATLGGVISAGLSGSGRYRYGGLRDFILGVRIVDGQGHLVRGGGKVVKNAAGFDLPKLMVGSLGRLGILVEASFKVFPAPVAYATLRADYPTLTAALAALRPVVQGPYDLEALDLIPEGDGVAVYIRMGGVRSALAERLARLTTVLGAGTRLSDEEEAALWEAQREFLWAEEGAALVKVATTPSNLPALDRALGEANADRRYAVGGNLTWIVWPGPLVGLHDLLAGQKLAGLVVRGAAVQPLIGRDLEWVFAGRIRQALDPNHRFVDYK